MNNSKTKPDLYQYAGRLTDGRLIEPCNTCRHARVSIFQKHPIVRYCKECKRYCGNKEE